MSDPRFPPVQPLATLDPWDQPQRLISGRASPASGRGRPSSFVGPGPGGVAWVANPHHYASLINLNYTVGTTSTLILSQPDTRRNFLGLRNAGATNLYINFGSDASTLSWIILTADTMMLFDMVVPQDDMYCISDAAGGILSVAYSTIAL